MAWPRQISQAEPCRPGRTHGRPSRRNKIAQLSKIGIICAGFVFPGRFLPRTTPTRRTVGQKARRAKPNYWKCQCWVRFFAGRGTPGDSCRRHRKGDRHRQTAAEPVPISCSRRGGRGTGRLRRRPAGGRLGKDRSGVQGGITALERSPFQSF